MALTTSTVGSVGQHAGHASALGNSATTAHPPRSVLVAAAAASMELRGDGLAGAARHVARKGTPPQPRALLQTPQPPAHGARLRLCPGRAPLAHGLPAPETPHGESSSGGLGPAQNPEPPPSLPSPGPAAHPGPPSQFHLRHQHTFRGSTHRPAASGTSWRCWEPRQPAWPAPPREGGSQRSSQQAATASRDRWARPEARASPQEPRKAPKQLALWLGMCSPLGPGGPSRQQGTALRGR